MSTGTIVGILVVAIPIALVILALLSARLLDALDARRIRRARAQIAQRGSTARELHRARSRRERLGLSPLGPMPDPLHVNRRRIAMPAIRDEGPRS